MGGRTRGPGAQHELRRAEIADAVLAVVADLGPAAVSLSEVAARAGVSPGRVQHYFPTKDRLITTAFERGNALSTARIERKVAEAASPAAPRTVVTVVLVELIPYDAATRDHLRVRHSFGALALTDEAIATRLRAEYAHLHDRLARLLERDRDAGLLREDADAREAAVSLVALAEGLAYYVLVGVEQTEAARGRLLRAIDGYYR
ncbi:TetR/AcrR family transcriptional regulator [Marinactinospora thermotolerans]|uniref:Transcriptional regulator, TetR family n=1 Tax=Marinactinospora thermotolerans DSM 45154 TaxID=1122192 RepID=A0A1T4NNI1_9ACTN|nr:TetR family transcriptional regulator C-terminal domain-containing protein [Marinactinospora thermotolerans]SJZ80665.1 transcriptional regulator, TetR family [Marinactinospora thermotolerans DSM 45154]